MKKFYYLTIGMLLLPAVCNSQNIELTFNHKALLVDDLENSASFYERILFLEEIEVPEGVTSMRWFSLSNGIQLHLIKVDNIEVKLHKAIHIALTTVEFEGYLKHLENNQINYENWAGDKSIGTSPYFGTRNIFIQDPSGHWIEIREEV